MKILLDQGAPVPLRRYLTDHEVETAFERGWSSVENGDLLDAAEQEGFDILITTDQNLKYQQNLTSRSISIIVLTSANWRLIQKKATQVQEACRSASRGSYIEVEI